MQILPAHPTGVQGVRNAFLIQGLRSCRAFFPSVNNTSTILRQAQQPAQGPKEATNSSTAWEQAPKIQACLRRLSGIGALRGQCSGCARRMNRGIDQRKD